MNSSRLSVVVFLSALSSIGNPLLHLIVISSGVFGAFSGSSVRVHKSAGGGLEGSSSWPLSYEQWAMSIVQVSGVLILIVIYSLSSIDQGFLVV